MEDTEGTERYPEESYEMRDYDRYNDDWDNDNARGDNVAETSFIEGDDETSPCREQESNRKKYNIFLENRLEKMDILNKLTNGGTRGFTSYCTQRNRKKF